MLALKLAAVLAAASAAEPTPEPRRVAPRARTAAAAARLFALGGSDPRSMPLGKVAAFSPAGNGSWAPARAMGGIRESGAAAELGGHLYHVGGSGPGRSDDAAYPYAFLRTLYCATGDSSTGSGLHRRAQ